MDVLDAEDATHPCRSRKIDPTAAKGSSEDVYVLRWFASEKESDEVRTEKAQEAVKEAQHKKKLVKRITKLDLEVKEDTTRA